MLNKNLTITFFLPSATNSINLGGAQVLFLSIAEYLANFYFVNMIVIPNSNLSNWVRNSKINFISLEYDNKISLIGNHIIITTYGRLKKLLDYINLHDGHKLFLWNIGPYCHINNFALLSYYKKIPVILRKFIISLFEYSTKKRLEELMLYLIENNNVAYMSNKNWDIVNEFLDLPIDKPFYLPVPLKPLDSVIDFSKKKPINKNLLHIGWLGRYSKTSTILRIINEISKVPQDVFFHIIGWGSESEKSVIKEYAHSLNIEFVFVEEQYNGELNTYILENVDIGIAMGLSLQNFSILEIPTIATQVFDISGSIKMDNTMFKWFFDLKNYDLATKYGIDKEQEDLHPLQFFLEKILQDYDYYSNRCLEFYEENYDFEKIAGKLVTRITSDNFRKVGFDYIEKLLKPNIFHKMKKKIKSLHYEY